MGCGSSTASGDASANRPIQVQPVASGEPIKKVSAVEPKPKVINNNDGFALAQQPAKLPPIKSEQKQQQNNAPAIDDVEKTGKGGVAFDIPVGTGGDAAGGSTVGGGAASAADIDKILRKPLPPRLRHLEPLENAPSITPEQLAEKLRKAEEKRERMLEKRRHSKVTKQSKARRELLKAQEFSGQQEAADEAGGAPAGAVAPEAEKLQQKQAVAEQKRLAQLAAVQERQRVREERAKAARERARRLKEEEQMEAELNIEKDEGGGDSDSDGSWLGEDDGNRRGRGGATDAAAAGQSATAEGAPTSQASEQPPHRDSSGYGSSVGGSRATTGKTASTVLEDDIDKDFYD